MDSNTYKTYDIGEVTTTTLMTNASDGGNETAPCGLFEGYSFGRFFIITVCSAIAAFGAVCNLLLLAIFRRSLPSSVFLAGLSLLDTLLCLTYLLLFGVDAGYVYLQSDTLFLLYHRYIVVVFFIARVVQMAMPYMLMFATLERFMWTTKDKTRECLSILFSDMGRPLTAFLIIFVAFLLRIVVLFAVEVVEFPDCDQFFRSQSVTGADWTVENEAYKIFDVHVVTMLQTVIPFFVLLLLNSAIVVKMCVEKKDQGMIARMREAADEVRREQQLVRMEVCTQHMVKKASIITTNSTLPEHYVLMEVANGMVQESFNSKSNREKAIQLRNAVITMTVIALSYLICNSLHLVLLYFEKFDDERLFSSEDKNMSSELYIILSDAVSISYMFSSAIRLFIYAKCNPKLRREMKAYFGGKHRPDFDST